MRLTSFWFLIPHNFKNFDPLTSVPIFYFSADKWMFMQKYIHVIMTQNIMLAVSIKKYKLANGNDYP